MLGFIRASADLFGTVSAPDRFSLGQLREILWPHKLNIQCLEDEENLLHPFFSPIKLSGRERLDWACCTNFMPPRERCRLTFRNLTCMVETLSLCGVAWRLTQGIGLQNCDPLLLRHKVKHVLDRCIEESWVNFINFTFYIAFSDLRGKAKRLWSLLCHESDKDKWHHCFCYL